MTCFFNIEPGKPEVIHYGACEGGHCALVIAAEDIGPQAALVLVERESNLTGWEFTTAGLKNPANQYVWALRRKDNA